MALKWTKREIMLMLELYLKYKDDFRGHGYKNLKIWQQIAWEMSEQGIQADYVRLDRKLRNMKRTYVSIKKKQLAARPNWEYFDIMEEIFGGTLNQTTDLTTTSEEEETVCEQKMEVKDEPFVFAHELMDESNFTDLISNKTTNEDQDVDVDGPFVNLTEELEFQRLEELRVIRITLQESNVIQKERNQILQERNELMRQYLSSTLKK